MGSEVQCILSNGHLVALSCGQNDGPTWLKRLPSRNSIPLKIQVIPTIIGNSKSYLSGLPRLRINV